MLVDRTETEPLLLIRIVDDAGEPISGITHDDEELSVALFAHLGTAWVPITLTAGTVGTYAANTIAEIGAGIYQLCLASSAITPGGVTQIRVVYADNDPLYDAIVARALAGVTVNAEAIASALIPYLAGITITIDTPVFSGTDGADLSVDQGDDYQTRPVRINIESETDYTGKYFVLAARLASNADAGMAMEMLIREDDDGQYALFAPSSAQTEIWSIGTYELRHRIKLAANKYHTVKHGRLTVRPFDTPANTLAVDPPES